ncbi:MULTISPECIES: FitA-like ribbon-helix-helix domain-containing protein [Cupriavidus]|uniref:Plasmid stabilization protein n=1 Tax=Cupriavidus pinatubonensis (strain JMP 134 / LMG 1197) TaxID=264198 RepID=Q46VM2_CUPPJ|nr:MULTISPECIES: plasmid stabilization protein [Cupriavidus]QYY31629.1 plasmid stabilization protein [Cupriavidus pinatubonensis]TPQ37245.1 plasmid stabilization protein [Cupriavidus pinatubonensis]
MATLTIRNLPDETHRALRVQAAAHGRSTEAEVRDILARAVNPPERVKMGEALAQLGRRLGLTNADVEALEQTRDRTPAQPPRFHE